MQFLAEEFDKNGIVSIRLKFGAYEYRPGFFITVFIITTDDELLSSLRDHGFRPVQHRNEIRIVRSVEFLMAIRPHVKIRKKQLDKVFKLSGMSIMKSSTEKRKKIRDEIHQINFQAKCFKWYFDLLKPVS